MNDNVEESGLDPMNTPQIHSPNRNVNRSVKRMARWIIRIALLLLLVALAPYLFSRIFAAKNRIRHFDHSAKMEVLEEMANLPKPLSDKSPDLTVESVTKVVAFNIAHGRGPTDDNWEEEGKSKAERIEQIASLLKRLDADVVVLNEVDFDSSWSGRQNQANAIAELAGYRFHVEQRNLDFGFPFASWNFGNAILSKHPITETSVVDFPPLKEWEDWLVGCKRGVVCQINPPGQSPFRIVAVHLEHRNEPVRVQSSKQIIDLAKLGGHPLIAAGDFNSTPVGFPQSNQTCENALDVLVASKQFQILPQSPPGPAELTFSSYGPKSTIDWVMLPPDWAVESYEPVDSDLSDHRPVVASFKITVSENDTENVNTHQQ